LSRPFELWFARARKLWDWRPSSWRLPPIPAVSHQADSTRLTVRSPAAAMAGTGTRAVRARTTAHTTRPTNSESAPPFDFVATIAATMSTPMLQRSTRAMCRPRLISTKRLMPR